MDSKQSQLVERYQDSLLKSHQDDNESESDSELLDLLDEDDSEIQKYREQRIQQLSSEFKKINALNRSDLGELTTVSDEKSLMQVVTDSESVIIHFFLPNFEKCSIMDSKLATLSNRHVTTKFVRIDVLNAPFLVAKLNIKVLPFLVFYRTGKELERLIGFEKLGNGTDFDIQVLEDIFLRSGIVRRKAINYNKVNKHSYDQTSEDDLDL